MEKVISFASTVRVASDFSATDLPQSYDLEKALKAGFIIKDFKQVITTGSSIFSNSKQYVVSTFILERQEA